VKDVYSKVLEGNEGGYEEVFQRLLKTKGQLTTQICSWRVFHNTLPTRDRLLGL